MCTKNKAGNRKYNDTIIINKITTGNQRIDLGHIFRKKIKGEMMMMNQKSYVRCDSLVDFYWIMKSFEEAHATVYKLVSYLLQR